MQKKVFYQSKTFWFGSLFVVNALAQTFGYGDFVPGGELNQWTSFSIGLVTWALRAVTHEKIK